MKIIVFLSFALHISFLLSQERYFIKDKYSEDPIPFVKVLPSGNAPFLSDLEGSFIWPSKTDSIKLRYTGYYDTLLLKSSLKNHIILLEPIIQEIEEIVITPGENPAHRIIDQAIENRLKNHPLQNDPFTCDNYNKFVFDANEEILAKIPDSLIDSLILKLEHFVETRHLFLIESVSKRTFIPPDYNKEEITAYKISGINDPMLSTFANEMQSFSFYDNQVDILGMKYINPLASGSLRRYFFLLEDTLYNGHDSTFVIRFRPQKNKEFNGMSGVLYINTNGYAIEKVIAKPYSTDGLQQIEVEVVQEYVFLDSIKWFPSRLQTQMVINTFLPDQNSLKGMIKGVGTTNVSNVKFNNIKLKKGIKDNVAITITPDVSDLNQEVWDSLRYYNTTDKEQLTYETYDSLSREFNLQRKYDFLKILTSGRIPLGKLNLLLERISNYNIYEGVRWGLGFETSDKFSKRIMTGAYAGWGSIDKQWKYGIYNKIYPFSTYRFRIDSRFQEDLIERGGIKYESNVFILNDTAAYRFFFITSMDKQRIAEVTLSCYLKSNLQFKILGNFQRVSFLSGYLFAPLGEIKSLDLAETGIEINWNIKEKNMVVGFQKISLGTNYPKISLRLVKGTKDIFTSNLNYWRFNIQVRQDFSIRGAGHLSWQINGGLTSPESPLFLNHVIPGTGIKWTPIALHTFETVKPSTYYSDKFSSFFVRYTFHLMRTKAKWNEPSISIHHGIGFGLMSNKLNHNIDFSTFEKGYLEGGLILKGLLISGFSSLGVGCFYNYGYYADADWRKNIMPKISMSFSLE